LAISMTNPRMSIGICRSAHPEKEKHAMTATTNRKILLNVG
jgi:hypothetical protein